MSLAASRVVLRRLPTRLSRSGLRHSSTTPSSASSSAASQATEAASSGASKISSAASSTSSKASQGLSRVTSSAGPALSGAAQGVGKALGRVGGRTGRFIAFVESIIPPAIYYSRVTIELSKMIFRAQKMQPPSIATVQAHFQPILNAVRNPTSLASAASSAASSLPSPVTALNSVRNVSRQQLAAGAVIAAETLGFFTVGEMIGRFKIVGYRGAEGGEHH
ncbi:MAG: hypothetical protein M1825_000514 [Sarcosagium campestre]|nr:MAG: hypothetical protein M1825_000514 [Sarcosagium campestre]